MVKIGRDLYQFAYGYMKVIRGGDASLIPSFFSTYHTDKASSIEVTRIRIASQMGAQEAGRSFVGQAANCRSPVGTYRVLVYEDVYFVPFPLGGYELEVTLQSRSRANLIWQNWSTQQLRANGQAIFFGQPTVILDEPRKMNVALEERIFPGVAGISTTSTCTDASTCLRSRTDGFGDGGTGCFTRNF